MPVHIDRFETSVEIAPSASPTPRTAQPPQQATAHPLVQATGEAMMARFVEEFERFARMRGH